ncbi:MAG: thioredoxin domain-containing protein [Betaproteobacteria bacterium]
MKGFTLGALGLAALCATAAAQGRQAAAPQPPLAVVAGQPIASAEVDALVRPQLAELRAREYQLRSQALEQLIAQALIAKEAAARGVSEEALEKAEVLDKAVVSEAEVRAYYDANKARIGSTPEAEALRQIREGLAQQRQNERRSAFARELRAKYDVRVLLEPYRVPVDLADAPVRGNPKAPVTVVEFSDFQCPYCVRARPTVARVREAYGDKLRWVFRHFPLSFHQYAEKAGEAAACAGDQGRFWEMHDRLWANHAKLEVPDLKAYAAALGLDPAAFDRCLDSGRHAGLVDRDLQAGASYGVSGTPAFFVNGRPLIGAQPFEAFQQVIDDELRRAGVAAAGGAPGAQ